MDIKNSSDQQINVVVIDEQALVRAGLVTLINTDPGMKVVGEAGELAKAIEIVDVQKPDIVLLGLNSANGAGPDAISMISKKSEQTRIIMVSSQTEVDGNIEALKHGALGIIFLTDRPENLVKAIRKVNSGEAWVERSLIADILHTISADESGTGNPEGDKIHELTSREKDVIQLIGRGFKNRQIAEQLNLSETTVRHHLTSIYHKLGVTSRLELLVFANRHEIT